ncbi:glucose-6-phosphate dehydrogenase [Bacteroidota bacterium]
MPLQDHILVIFGASGDLAKRKLLPAIIQLQKNNFLPSRFAILGIGRTSYIDSSFRTYLEEQLGDYIEGYVPEAQMLNRIYYYSMDPYDENAYNGLIEKLSQIRSSSGITENYIFYLATPPSLYNVIPVKLSNAGLLAERNASFKRVIIEKPFGLDLLSAQKLNAELLGVMAEDQVYRIDHYLGKETVQNILVTRFSNGIYEPLWNRNYVDHVEITSAESMGVGDRGGYYDKSGALRDMLQNHLLQLVALIAMEPPSVIDSDTIRNEMLKVFQSFRRLDYENLQDSVIRGQYVESSVRKEKLIAYRNEKGVPDDSRTETFVALKLFIDNWRWGGVPFYIRTGKRLPTKVTEVVIHFKPSPHTLFSADGNEYKSANQLVIRIQPDEGILLKFGMKVPGAGYDVQTVNMDFHYKDLSNDEIPEAYERLLLDCMQGDSTLYARGDAVEAAWEFVDPVIKRWNDDPDFPLHGYPCGTWGPEQADQLIEGEKLTWRYPCKNLADDGNYCEL